ncbi:MAG: ACP S-malonyltransferase [Alphaproteobacteria bacterium]|nr:ACP S-malonyltransferase [Alphaproteobacteria bacterium]
MKAIIFPGQGSQTPGMCSELYHKYPYVRTLWEEANDLLGFSLSNIILEGAAEDLKRTSYTQPGLFLAGVSVWRVLEEETGVTEQDVFLAGHSVGEYAALVAAKSLEFSDAIKVLGVRGQIMEEAEVDGGLVALIGGETEDVERLVWETNDQCLDSCSIALFNAPSQHVVGGPRKTLAVLKEKVAAPIRRAVDVAVSGPFHTPYMAFAQERLLPILKAMIISPPERCVFSSVTGAKLEGVEDVRAALSLQTQGPVLWTHVMRLLYNAEVRNAVEAGPGTVLAGLMRKTVADLVVRPYDAVLEEYAK